MPGPIDPNWGIPQPFASRCAGATFDRTSGGLRCVADGVVRFPTLGKKDDGFIEWNLFSDSEGSPLSLPVFPIEDNQTIAVLTRGLFQSSQGTIVYGGIPYNLSIQRSHVSSRVIAVAIPA